MFWLTAGFAHEPAWFTTAPVGAIRKLLKTVDWNINDVDLFEINEAFAAQALYCIKKADWDESKINLNGARKGDATSTAIILEPSGSTLNKGMDKKLYIVFANGDNKMVHIAIDEIIISSLFLSSSRWSVNE